MARCTPHRQPSSNRCCRATVRGMALRAAAKDSIPAPSHWARMAKRGRRRRHGHRATGDGDDPQPVRVHARNAATGSQGVDEFLFVQKAGFCEHFSSAFVVLMRAAGIPGARRHRLRRWLLEPDRRLLAGTPIRCARMGRSVAAGPRLGACGPDRGGRAGSDLRHAGRSRTATRQPVRRAMPARYSTSPTGCAMAGTTSPWGSMRPPARTAGPARHRGSRAHEPLVTCSCSSRCWRSCGWLVHRARRA